MSIKGLIVAKLILGLILLTNANKPTVKINQGVLEGQIKTSRYGQTYNSFTGIPYAKPPIDGLRFQPSVAAIPWKGVLDATKPHSKCLQPYHRTKNITVIGNEDCLYLNVYTPELQPDQKLAVMVFIHGGGFTTGSASDYDPKLFMDHDVVLVTINYRLGALGFLTTQTFHLLGNDGLKDQVLALKWVKNNIESFGGDPNRITLFGQGAGGISAHYHTISPLSKDLISGVIAQSGTAMSRYGMMPYFLSSRLTKFLAERVGCPIHGEMDDMMECFLYISGKKIVEAAVGLTEWDIEPVVLFKPVMEAEIEGAFMTIDPYESFATGKSADVPFMTGVTLNEGDFRAEQLFEDLAVANVFMEDMEKKLPIVLDYKYTAIPKYFKSATESLQAYYFKKNFNKRQFSKLYMDAFYLFSANAAAETHSTYLKQPIYYYAFGYKGSETYCKFFNTTTGSDDGVCHSDDLLYLFDNNEEFSDYVRNDSENDMVDLLTKLWTNFAKYGNPTPEDISELPKWEPYTINKPNHYFIKDSKNIENEAELYGHRSRFWKNLKLEGRTLRIKDEL